VWHDFHTLNRRLVPQPDRPGVGVDGRRWFFQFRQICLSRAWFCYRRMLDDMMANSPARRAYLRNMLRTNGIHD